MTARAWRDRSRCLYCGSGQTKASGLFQCGTHVTAVDIPGQRTADCYSLERKAAKKALAVERMETKNNIAELKERIELTEEENSKQGNIINTISDIAESEGGYLSQRILDIIIPPI